MRALKLKALIPTEDDEQAWLFQWAQTQKHKGKRLSDFLIMVPNGAYLGADAKQRAITMARLKRQGFKNGVFDVFLAIPKDGIGGLWIEMKRRELSIVSLEQSKFQMQMRDIGYCAEICKGWEEARAAIEEYLE